MSSNKVATIVPKKHLHLTKDDDYFMALSFCLEDKEYADFFRERSGEGKFVTLDNSAIELGEPEPFETYFDKALSIGASQIMLPDYFLDPEATYESAKKIIQTMGTRMAFVDMRVMIIPQGKTTTEWSTNAYKLINLLYQYAIVPTVGISYRYRTKLFDGHRPLALLHLAKNHIFESVHFLGSDRDPGKELRDYLELDNVLGVDSSYPSVYAQQNIKLTKPLFQLPRPPREIDFLNDAYNETLLVQNIEAWKHECQPN